MGSRQLVLVMVVAAALAASLAGVVSTESGAKPGKKSMKEFNIALIGDIPYTEAQETQTANLFEELSARKLAFITHDGDIKSGSSACTEDVYEKEFERFEASRNPLVYTPGDNEWTDCHRPPNPTPEEADPLDRLELVRDTFFPEKDRSLGRSTISLTRQSDEYPENARWTKSGVTFATLHVVGSNNNRRTTLPSGAVVGDDVEYEARNAANLEWLASTFDQAREKNSPGVMLVIQANPFEEDINEPSGFTEFKTALAKESAAFDGPVVLVHGDTHTFRIDKPMAEAPNFTRVETFGSPNVHWVRATVNPREEEVFSFQPRIVDENVAPATP